MESKSWPQALEQEYVEVREQMSSSLGDNNVVIIDHKKVSGISASFVNDQKKKDLQKQMNLEKTAIEEYRMELEEKGIKWIAQLNQELTPIKAKPRVMAHALFNLFLNAVDSTDGMDDRRITVGTHQTDHDILLQLIDNGAGTSQADLGKNTENDSQIGLRIAAAREAIQSCGGAIRVDTSPGKGTKVTLKFKRN